METWGSFKFSRCGPGLGAAFHGVDLDLPNELTPLPRIMLDSLKFI